MTITPIGRTLALATLLLALTAVDVQAQRGASFRGGGGSVRYGAVRGDTSRRTHNRSNPAAPTRANSGSIRAGRTPGASPRPGAGAGGLGIDRPRPGEFNPIEPGSEPPRPGRSGTPEGGSRGEGPVSGGGVPAIGSSVEELPEEATAIRVSGQKYSYHLGLFYRPRFSFGAVEYERVPAPKGAVLAETPPGAREVTVGSTTYREYADTWFKPIRRRNRDQWMVVEPPIKLD